MQGLRIDYVVVNAGVLRYPNVRIAPMYMSSCSHISDICRERLKCTTKAPTYIWTINRR